MKSKWTEVTLGSIGNGAAQELFARELAAVLANMQDVNTKHDAKRKITLSFVFAADEARETCSATIKCESKLAPVKPLMITAQMTEGKDGEATLVQRQGGQSENVVAMKGLEV
jgi:hypothetical protein